MMVEGFLKCPVEQLVSATLEAVTIFSQRLKNQARILSRVPAGFPDRTLLTCEMSAEVTSAKVG